MSEPVTRECDGGCGRTVHGWTDKPGDRVLCADCAAWERDVEGGAAK